MHVYLCPNDNRPVNSSECNPAANDRRSANAVSIHGIVPEDDSIK
jgi:hypothetical protein